jgi:hypothetical protein
LPTLTRYTYDPRSGAYVGETGAHEDPQNPGQFLEPAFSTPLAPPPPIAGMAASWTKLGWRLQPDHRGETWWRGVEPVLIDGLGDPVRQGLTAAPVFPDPPPPTSCSKLGLKRAFDELGLWQRVKEAISADPDTQEDWDLAIEIQRTDPLVIKMQALLGLTDDQVTKIIARAVALVQPRLQAA